MAQETTSHTSFGELLLHQKLDKKLLDCQYAAKNDRNENNSLTSRLQRCDPQTAQDITFTASFTETLLLHEGERQKPVQC